MPDKQYKERLTDRDILKLLHLGRYKVDLDTGEVFQGNGKPLKAYEGNEEKHLWVRLYGFKKRKAIAVHRLVWLAGAGRPIPKGFQIHHRNLDTQDNRWSNLFCLHERDHRKLHSGPGGDLIDEDIPF